MATPPPYAPDPDRYDHATFRRCGRSGLDLPAISLGLWHNFGDDRPLDTQRAILRRAFDRGSPTSTWPTTTARPTAAPRQLRHALRAGLPALPRRAGPLDQGRLRHVARPVRQGGGRASTCWPAWTSRWPDGRGLRRHLLQPPLRPDTPLEETMGRRWDTAVRSGRALYAGISSYSGERTREAACDPARPGHPAADPPARPTRCSTAGSRRSLLDVPRARPGSGCIAFSPLGPGHADQQVPRRHPADSRAARTPRCRRTCSPTPR
jgi:L-glyceraldehyde 3-phosphate reductase